MKRILNQEKIEGLKEFFPYNENLYNGTKEISFKSELKNGNQLQLTYYLVERENYFVWCIDEEGTHDEFDQKTKYQIQSYILRQAKNARKKTICKEPTQVVKECEDNTKTLVEIFEDEGLLKSNDKMFTLNRFYSYTLPSNPYTHLSINGMVGVMEIDMVVRLGGESKKGDSLTKFISHNWEKYLKGVDAKHLAYMISVGTIPSLLLHDWVNEVFNFLSPNPFDTKKVFGWGDLGEDDVVEEEMDEEKQSYWYQQKILEQLLNS